LLDIQDWRNGDESIILTLQAAMVGGSDVSAVFQSGVFATHVVAAAVTAAFAGVAAPGVLMRRMVAMLKALGSRNPTWGPLAIVHRGSIARDYLSSHKLGAVASGQSYSADDVFDRLRDVVYPDDLAIARPDIRRWHKLKDDLGFDGNSAQGLAFLTNSAFKLTPPEYFIPTDFNSIDTVGKHADDTCAKLDATGRLLH
jgi:hypothetical protein